MDPSPVEEVEKKPLSKLEAKRAKPHYVNNRDFSNAIVEHVSACLEAKEQGVDIPVVSRYIGDCILRICNGLSFKPNFIRYTYREEMVMDAVENCLKAIKNYDISTVTRTGQPNAFSYFTQISYYAFLRRIAKEKKQHDIAYKLIDNMEYSDFVDVDDILSNSDDQSYYDDVKSKLNSIQQNFSV